LGDVYVQEIAIVEFGENYSMDITMVDTVLKFSIVWILRRLRIFMKQERERWVMWS